LKIKSILVITICSAVLVACSGIVPEQATVEDACIETSMIIEVETDVVSDASSVEDVVLNGDEEGTKPRKVFMTIDQYCSAISEIL